MTMIRTCGMITIAFAVGFGFANLVVTVPISFLSIFLRKDIGGVHVHDDDGKENVVAAGCYNDTKTKKKEEASALSSSSSSSLSSFALRGAISELKTTYKNDGDENELLLLPFSLDTWPEQWIPSSSSSSTTNDNSDISLDPAPPLHSSAHIWDGSKGYHLLRTYSDHTPHSVKQWFSRDLLSSLFDSDSSDSSDSNAMKERSSEWMKNGKFAWCGGKSNTNSEVKFYVKLEPIYRGTVKIPYACPSNHPNAELIQQYIEQGITNHYAFNDNEAYCSLQKAMNLMQYDYKQKKKDESSSLKSDSILLCPLVFLFKALVLGPNVNIDYVANENAYNEIILSLVYAEKAIHHNNKILVNSSSAKKKKAAAAAAADTDKKEKEGREQQEEQDENEEKKKKKKLMDVSMSVSSILLEAFKIRYLPFITDNDINSSSDRMDGGSNDNDNNNNNDKTNTNNNQRVASYYSATFNSYLRDRSILSYKYSDFMYVNAYQNHPYDDLLSMLTVSALLQVPTWKWWKRGSEYLYYDDDDDDDDDDNNNNKRNKNNNNNKRNKNNNNNSNNNKKSHEMILKLSTNIKQNNARANQIIYEVMQRDVNNLSANHFLIHSIEGSSQPFMALSTAYRIQSLHPGGHMQHMSGHIYTRLGYYSKSIEWNKRATYTDFKWLQSRSPYLNNNKRNGGGGGGSFLSPLYRYEPHNIAFQTEAAMHCGNWKELCSSLALQSNLISYRIHLDYKNQYLLLNFIAKGYLYPLKFGLYNEILRDLDLSPFDKFGRYEYEYGKYVTCYICLLARLHSKAVSAARLNQSELAKQSITDLLLAIEEKNDSINDDDDDDDDSTTAAAAEAEDRRDIRSEFLPWCTDPTKECVEKACSILMNINITKYPFLHFKQQQGEGGVGEGGVGEGEIGEGEIEGENIFLTNFNALQCLYVLVPYAELLYTNNNKEDLYMSEIMFTKAWEIQKLMLYDEPSPFYYPIIMTLGKVQYMQGKYNNAINSFRQGLFTWPNCIFLSLGLYESLKKKKKKKKGRSEEELVVVKDGGAGGGAGGYDDADREGEGEGEGEGWDESFKQSYLNDIVFTSNDTVIDFNWL